MYLSLLKGKYKKYEKEMLHFKSQLYAIEIEKVFNASI